MFSRSLVAAGVCRLGRGLLDAFRGARGCQQAPGSSARLKPGISRVFGPVLGASLLSAAPLPALAGRALATSTSADIIAQLQFKEMGLLSWLIVDVAINWGGWAVASLLKTEKFYDMLGSASFLTLSIGSLLASKTQHPRKAVLTSMIACWAIRLGSFLVMRVHKQGGDSRFDEAKHKPLTFFVYWTMQAVWVFTTSLPLLLLNTSSTGGPRAIIWSDILGVGLWVTGFLMETVADWQKYKFKADPANRGRFIDEGLWTYARYPNYCGEMLVWWGVFCTAAGGLQGAQFAAVVSPVFVMMLLRFVSGIPLQEKQAQARWGTTPEYQAYLARTNLLIPLPKPCGTKQQ